MKRKEKTLEQQCAEFFLSRDRSKWIEDDVLHIYVRKSTRVFRGEYVSCIDVANLVPAKFDSSGNPASTGGRFREFMIFLETNHVAEALYFENVLTDRLREILAKNGWIESGMEDDCYFKFKEGGRS